MKTHSIVPLALAALFLMQAAPAMAANLPILEVSATDIYMMAGQENSFTVRLENTGEMNVLDVEALLSSNVPGISILSEAHKVYNEIYDETTVKYSPVVYVDSEMPLGPYTLTLKVIYRRWGFTQDSSVTVPVVLIVNQGYVPKLKYSGVQGDVKAKSGTETTVEYLFSNNWDETLHDLQFTLSSTDGYTSVVEGVDYEFMSLSPGESLMVSPTLSVLEGAPLGAYTVSCAATFRDGDGDQFFQQYMLPLNVDQASITRNTILTLKEMEIEGGVVQPGALFQMRLDVACEGSDAYEVLSTVVLGASGISPVSPTTINLGDVAAGEVATSTYTLLADGDLDAGQYPITVTTTYTDSKGARRVLTETLTVLVDELLEFELLDNELAVYPGETGELEADLLLLGTDSVQFVSLELVESAAFKQTQGSTEYIGAIDPDSPIPFDVDFTVPPDVEPGLHEMKLRISYRDHLNREKEEYVDTMVIVEEGANPAIEDDTEQGGLFGWLRRLFGR